VLSNSYDIIMPLYIKVITNLCVCVCVCNLTWLNYVNMPCYSMVMSQYDVHNIAMFILVDLC
jgi:hypothetical protein